MWREHRGDKVRSIYGRSEIAPNRLRHVSLLWCLINVKQDEEQCCNELGYFDTANSVGRKSFILSTPYPPVQRCSYYLIEEWHCFSRAGLYFILLYWNLQDTPSKC
jgi:hypothetical protein